MTRPIRPWKSSFLILSLGIALHAPDVARAASEHIQNPIGNLRDAVLADLKPHASASKTYNEFWTYHFFLDGNLQADLNFSRVNLGRLKAPVCGADLTLLGFKGKNYSVAREYDKKNFVFTDSISQLRVHEKIWFQGGLPASHRTHFATTKKDVSYYLDLTFTEIEPGKVWGDGMFRFGGSDAVGIFWNIPGAKVSGVLAVNGDTLHVKGTAYMDHTFQTDLAPNLVNAGYRYSAQSGPLEVGYYLNPTSRFQSQPVGYGLRKTGSEYTLLSPQSLKVLSAANALGSKVATVLEIRYPDGGITTLKRADDRFQQSTLHEFSGLTKMAIKSFMGGEVLVFKGLGTLGDGRAIGYSYFTVN